MFPFTPRYLKHAKLMLKGVTRFLDYKRDLLPPAKLAEINGLREEFKTALKARDQKRLSELSEQLNTVCEKALPAAQPNWLADNIEVMFVAIVIALGIRAYIATLFQIPTGSMQPTLNGITAVSTAENPDPGFMGRMLGLVTGERYVNVVSDHEGELQKDNPATEQDETLSEHRFLIFMPYCRLHFADGHSIKIGAPKRQLMDELGLWQNLRSQVNRTADLTPDMRETLVLRAGGIYIRKGQLLARGILRNGDQVIVDKMSYHFRAPKRGEVFVFTTKHIQNIENQSNFDPRHGAQHYIKRLAGVPGDYLEVKEPQLYINGQVAQEPGFQRVMQGTEFHDVDGYRGYQHANSVLRINRIELRPGQYFAMGDNSFNSFDSRGWGTVPDRNLVGPALWTYWPLTKHWGPIK